MRRKFFLQLHNLKGLRIVRQMRRGGYYNLYTPRTRKYCKKKRELKSFQNQLFERILL